MTPEERAQLIDRYAEGYNALAAALAEAEDVMEIAPPGEWTPRQIAHHVADAAVIQSARLRILLAEDDPYIPGFDEIVFADRLQYDRSIVSSLVLLHATQDANLELLDGLTGRGLAARRTPSGVRPLLGRVLARAGSSASS